MSDAQVRGSVKWYNQSKGYGFITVDGQVKDVFFHAKEWNTVASGSVPVEGEALTFNIAQGPKGPYATNILRIGGVNPPTIGSPA